jgi:mannose-1-phosphate guanylyltransferase
MLHAVVMAGGSGTRFWPQSRRGLPKQFLRLGTQRTLIQETVCRCAPLVAPQNMWVVAGPTHAQETRRQLPELDEAQLIIEPCARNTAPAIGLAAIQLLASDPDAVMLVVPADHVITPAAAFHEAARRAVKLVQEHPQGLVLFGVPPTFPATGFGYIQRGELVDPHDHGARHVAAFKEKPNLITAARYLASDEYYWNCGIFVWRARSIYDALAELAPEIASRLDRLAPQVGTSDWNAALAAEFPQFPNISIDYAVLEKARNVYVLPAPFQWDDVGSWQALARLQKPDADGNVIDGLFCGVESTGCIIRSSSEHLVTAIGVKDLIIVHTPTATLVADKRDEDAIKKLILEIERAGLDRFL